MDLPSEVLFFLKHRQPNLCFFEENAEVCSIFLYKNRNAWSNLCFPTNYIIYTSTNARVLQRGKCLVRMDHGWRRQGMMSWDNGSYVQKHMHHLRIMTSQHGV